MSNTNTKIWFLLLAAVILVGCASTEFASWEGRNSIVEGRGGTREVINGVDIWTHGDPPRRYKVLGFIEDERGGGIIPMASLKDDIAQKTKEKGGDAVIFVSSGSELRGYYNTMHFNRYGSGSGLSVPITRRNSTYVVIKYLG